MYTRDFSDNASGHAKTSERIYLSRFDFLSARYKCQLQYRFPAKSRVALVSLNGKHARFLASRRDRPFHFSSHGFSPVLVRLNSSRYNLHSSRIIPVIGFRPRTRVRATQRRVICRFLRVRLLPLDDIAPSPPSRRGSPRRLSGTNRRAASRTLNAAKWRKCRLPDRW